MMNGSVSGSAPSAPGSQKPGAMPCGKKIPTKRGFGVAASVAANATDAGSMASSNGSANVQPALLRNVRRGMCRLVMIMGLLHSLAPVTARAAGGVARHRLDTLHVHLERLAVDDAEDERREAILVAHRVARNRAYEGHVPVLDAAAERIDPQLLRHDLRELRGVGQQPLS